MSKRRRKRQRKPKNSAARRPASPGPRVTTPEGDPMVFANALYHHDALDEIQSRLREADDFDWDESLESGLDGAFQVAWLETDPGAKPPPDPLSRRILATLTLAPTTLVVETISRQRLRACRKRLEQILSDRIHHVGTKTKTPDQVLREPIPPAAPEPLILPPEAIAELEERMIRQWLDESIPALDGLTPREAAKTEEGRERLEALFDYIARDQGRREMPPGVFSPDYSKAKKMLGLE